MAKAMIGGIIRSGLYPNKEIIAADHSESTLEQAHGNLGVVTAASNTEAAEKAGIVVLSVKPQFYESVIREIAPAVTPEKLVITIAPGKTLEWLGKTFGKPVKIVRAMPNTPAMVGEGIAGLCCNELVTKGEMDTALSIFNSFGKGEAVPERLMDAVVSVSGSSPAYVFLLIEAMADAAVADGMPRAQAYTFAAQAVLGSAKMVLETGKHPGELKDMVCSPAGTTIEAVRVLEQKGFRSSIMEAMKVCTAKSRSL